LGIAQQVGCGLVCWPNPCKGHYPRGFAMLPWVAQLSGSAARLLVPMVVGDGQRLRQGDCKGAPCNGTLPGGGVAIVKPPGDCPRSNLGMYWGLGKTLYGLARPAHHWYTTIPGHPTKGLGSKAMGQGGCVPKCQPFAGKPPIYLGLYVDDFVYYPKPGGVEQWFGGAPKAPHAKVDPILSRLVRSSPAERRATMHRAHP